MSDSTRRLPPERDDLTRREFLDRGSRLALSLGAAGSAFGRRAPVAAGDPGTADAAEAARAAVNADELTLGNAELRATWTVADGAFRPVRLSAGDGRVALPLSRQAFVLGFADRSTLAADVMRVVGAPRVEAIAPDPRASRL